MRAVTFPGVVVVVALVASTAACDLFGAVKCNKDADCPGGVPFCVSGTCAKTNDTGGGGHGLDNCATDADCPGGLCFDGTTAIATPGDCLPPADAANDCSADPDAGNGRVARDPNGAVIFDVQATALGDGCWSNISFTYFERQAVPITSAGVELVVNGATLTSNITSGDETTVAVDSMCGSVTSGHRAGIALNTGNLSNVACLPVQP